MLDAFDADAGQTLTVSQDGDRYDFSLGSGEWSSASGPLDGVTTSGSTLSLDADAVAQLTGGVTIAGDGETPLNVVFGQVDFSAMPGALEIAGATSIGQQPFSLLTAPSSSPIQLVAPPAGLTVNSLNVAGDFNAIAFGPIVDGPGTQITVTGDATFTSLRRLPDADFDSSGLVDSADYDIWAANYGTAAGATRAEGDANGDGRVDAADYTAWRNTVGEAAVDGGITLTDTAGDSLTVGGRATFNAFESLALGGDGDRFDIRVGGPSGGDADFASVSATGAHVSIFESSGTTLAAIDAESATIDSAGDLDDFNDDGVGGSDASLAVAGDADFTAVGSITLGDAVGETLTVGGKTSLTGSMIAVGDAGDFNTGTLSFNAAGSVTIQEDSATEVAMANTAGSLDLVSAGSLSDSAGTSVAVMGDATLTAAGAITLNDGEGDALVVDGKTSLAGSMITVGEAGVFNTGTLNFNSAGSVTIQEDSATEVAMTNTAGSLELSSDGAVTDSVGTSVAVTGDATITAATGVVLNDAGADLLSVDGLASFAGTAITVGGAGVFNAGTLNFDALGAVTIEEDSSTEVAMTNTAGSLDLSSDGAITDSVGTSIAVLGDEVLGDATLTAANEITLNDDAGDTFTVNGKTSFTGATITVGDAGVFNTGTLNFNAPGAVTIEEDSSTALAMENTAGTLDLSSDGELTDEPTATLFVTTDAAFFGESGIVLADDNFAPNGNSVVVAGFASFAVAENQSIDVGVISDGSASDGLPAAAVADFGSLQFTAVGGMVRLAEDSGTVLGGSSDAMSAQLLAVGSITDAAGASIEIPGSAELIATGGDVVLGDADATFAMGAPALFDAARFLAIQANNVSVQADSAINVRTGAADPAIPGTYYLSAVGPVSQVGDTSGVVTPLTTGRLAIDSGGAALLSSVELTTPSDETEPANLAIHAGASADIAELDGANGDAFPTDLIPSDAVTELSPIGVSPATAVAQPNGLVTLESAAIDTAAPIGDGYSIVVLVEGDATVGEVADATAAQPSLVGLDVSSPDGNAFLQTRSTGEAGDLLFSSAAATPGVADVPEGVVVQMAGGVLTAVAAGLLRIDTTDPEEPLPAVARTTALRSATGVVTSVDPFTTFDGVTESDVALVGPRLVLDPPDDDPDAATSELVLSSTDFLQRVTLGIGSRGEDNLVVVVDWAEVVDPLRSDLTASRIPIDPTTPGVIALPEVALAPAALDGATPEAGLIQQSSPPIDFRVVTIPHRFDEAFIPFNPLVDTLPTAVTVFNDPAINLFDQFVETDGGVSPRDLNSNANAFDAFVRAVETGFSMPIPRAESTPFVQADPVFVEDGNVSVRERVFVEDAGVATSASVEVILYGRVDPNDPEQWADDVPGEAWPQEWKDADGDFLRDIRERIDEGPSSEGRYRIVVETSRGSQPLEEWVKGDRVDAAFGGEPTAAPPTDKAVVPVDAGAAITPEAIDAAIGAAAPAETAIPREPAVRIVGTVAGAVAAAAGIRGRISLGGPIEFDQDRVGYTRAARRRRAAERSARG